MRKQITILYISFLALGALGFFLLCESGVVGFYSLHQHAHTLYFHHLFNLEKSHQIKFQI